MSSPLNPSASRSPRPNYAPVQSSPSPTNQVSPPGYASYAPRSSLPSSHIQDSMPGTPSFSEKSALMSPSPLRGSKSTSTTSTFSIDAIPINHHQFVPSPPPSERVTPLPKTFGLSPYPGAWDLATGPEPDDALHNPDKRDLPGSIFSARGFVNLGCLTLVVVAIIGVFAGYPIASWVVRTELSNNGAFGIGGTNASGQVPQLTNGWGLVDEATPDYARTRTSFKDGRTQLELVFSDEFEVDGRTFYPGDDPYWEAADLHYWQTGNLEWYDPAAITTRNGALEITLSKKETHGLDYQGGMITSWNKFCFTGGLVEVAVTIPGANDIFGLWPAVWTMGNLGRAGYGATLDGMWPYSYDTCDVGTVVNQTVNGQPEAALINGDIYNNGVLSILPGQRLSRCTCEGESHPGPKHKDGSYVGRSAPEIDIFEAEIYNNEGSVSQSVQYAPMNYEYIWKNTTGNFEVADASLTYPNTYLGGAYQQAISKITLTDQNCYEIGGTGCFAAYGIEYQPGFGDAYINWIANNKTSWILYASGLAADSTVQIDDRPISQEPMYIIANLGISTGFGFVDFDHLTFPTTMRIDYVRVYQDSNSINIGCDPPEFPTSAYINQYLDAYMNPNYTTFTGDLSSGGFGQTFPKNSFSEGPC